MQTSFMNTCIAVIIVLHPDVQSPNETHVLPHNSYRSVYMLTLLSNQQISRSSLLDSRDLAFLGFNFHTYITH